MGFWGARQYFAIAEQHAQNLPQSFNKNFLSAIIGGTQLILSRRLCSFRSKKFDTDQLSTRMLSALVLETQAHSPYLNTGIYITFSNAVANVWTWDSDLIQKISDVPARHAVPETLFHDRTDGFKIRACIEGYEGQFWFDGVLLSSRWWPEVPTEEDWANFVRAGGGDLPPNFVTNPETIEQGFQNNVPITRNLTPTLHQLKQLPKSVFVSIGLAILSIVFVFYGVRNVVLETAKQTYDKEQLVLQEATSEKRVLRRQLIRYDKELEAYSSILSVTEPLTPITNIAANLSELGAEVSRLSYESGQIEIRFESKSKFSPRDLVQDLEQLPGIEEVSIKRLGLTDIWSISANSVLLGQLDD